MIEGKDLNNIILSRKDVQNGDFKVPYYVQQLDVSFGATGIRRVSRLHILQYRYIGELQLQMFTSM